MIQEAYVWYEEQRSGLGEDFLKALDITFQKLTDHPQYFGIVEKQFRQAKLLRFPYVLVFEIMEENVVVFAVFHTAKNPKTKLRSKK